jgi:hypothetical protein
MSGESVVSTASVVISRISWRLYSRQSIYNDGRLKTYSSVLLG